MFVLCLISMFILSFEKTEMAFVMHRHGERMPLKVAPNDNENLWTENRNLGDLSSRGYRQLYDVGQKLKKKYIQEIQLISPIYNSSQLYVRSSDVDRCLMSAQSLLLGLYNYTAISSTNDYLPHNFQPIPIHTVPTDQDYLLRGHLLCIPFVNYRSTSLLASNANVENKDYFLKVEELLGIKNLTFESFGAYMDAILVHHEQNNLYNIFPKYRYILDTDDFINRGRKLKNERFNMLYQGIEHSKLSCGLYIPEILSKINDHIHYGNTTIFNIYSAHDSTIAGLLSNLFYSDFVGQPIYGATLIIELLHIDNKYFIKTLYNHEPFRVKDCELLCPLEEFKEITKVTIIDDYMNLCKQPVINGMVVNVNPQYNNILAIIFVGCLILATLLSCYCVNTFANRKSKNV